MNYLSEALMKTLGDKSYSLKMNGVRNFPNNEFKVSFDLISLIGVFLYEFIFQLTGPVIVSGIVYEKEHSLREVMKMMGLKQHIYWLVTYFFCYMLYFITLAFFLILAAILKFRFFFTNDFGLVLFFFLLWGHVSI